MKDIDKAYTTYDHPDEEHPDTWEFLGQQIKGLVAFAAIVVGLWMIVAAVVLK
jgi:hypothetical protein